MLTEHLGHLQDPRASTGTQGGERLPSSRSRWAKWLWAL